MTITHADTARTPVPTQSTYQSRVADYWNAEENPVNLELGKIDDLYHHHYGIGEADRSVLNEPDPGRRRDRVTGELHRLEHAQAELLASHLGGLSPTDRVFDAGCGRGGGSVVAHLRYGCHADGATISAKQADFANGQARKRGIDDKVRYHHRNMLEARRGPDGGRAAVLGVAPGGRPSGHGDRGHLPDRVPQRQLPVPADRRRAGLRTRETVPGVRRRPARPSHRAGQGTSGAR